MFHSNLVKLAIKRKKNYKTRMTRLAPLPVQKKWVGKCKQNEIRCEVHFLCILKPDYYVIFILKSISSSQGFKASPPGGAAFETLHQPTKGAYNTEKQLGFGSREPCILKISYLGNVCNITKHLYK